MRHVCSLIVALAALGSTGAQAELRAVGGDMRRIDAPASVEIDQLTDDSVLHIFEEAQGVTLPYDVDAAAVVDASGPTRVTVPAGTIVDSHLVHFDLPGVDMRSQLVGSAAFTDPIVGLVVDTDELVRTDDVLGSSTTVYDTDPDRGLDFGTDLATVTRLGAGEPRRIEVDLTVDFGLDQVRVLTSRDDDAQLDAGATGTPIGDPAAGYEFHGVGGCGCEAAGMSREPGPAAWWVLLLLPLFVIHKHACAG